MKPGSVRNCSRGPDKKKSRPYKGTAKAMLKENAVETSSGLRFSLWIRALLKFASG